MVIKDLIRGSYNRSCWYDHSSTSPYMHIVTWYDLGILNDRLTVCGYVDLYRVPGAYSFVCGQVETHLIRSQSFPNIKASIV